jgi:hypothetical protein
MEDYIMNLFKKIINKITTSNSKDTDINRLKVLNETKALSKKEKNILINKEKETRMNDYLKQRKQRNKDYLKLLFVYKNFNYYYFKAKFEGDNNLLKLLNEIKIEGDISYANLLKLYKEIKNKLKMSILKNDKKYLKEILNTNDVSLEYENCNMDCAFCTKTGNDACELGDDLTTREKIKKMFDISFPYFIQTEGVDDIILKELIKKCSNYCPFSFIKRINTKEFKELKKVSEKTGVNICLIEKYDEEKINKFIDNLDSEKLKNKINNSYIQKIKKGDIYAK